MIAITETTSDGRSIRVEADTVEDAVAALREINPVPRGSTVTGIDWGKLPGQSYVEAIFVPPDPDDTHYACNEPADLH